MIQTSNYSFPSQEEQFQSMTKKSAKPGSEEGLSALHAGFEKVQQIKDIAKIELLDKTEAADFKYWRQVLTDEIDVCKKVMKWVKQQDNSVRPKLAATLEKMRALKIDLQMLQEKAVKQEQLVQNREDLYHSRELPSVASFDQRLEGIVRQDPTLKEGCQHFQDVLKRQAHVIQRSIQYSDFEQLKAFYQKIEKNGVAAELAPLVKHEIDVLKKTFERKESLLKDLSLTLPELGKKQPFNEWPLKQKLTFYVKAQQILENPFEPPIDFLNFQTNCKREDSDDSKAATAFHALCQLIEREKQNPASSKKNDFWDFADIFEKKAHQLAATQEQKEEVYALKMEGLREILAKTEACSDQEVLIIGGGPAGLMRALSLGFSGHPYRVLEKRANEAPKRSNVITLASGNPSKEGPSRDLNILLFLGFITAVDKDERASFGHIKPNLMEIPIGDVERYLMQVVTDIGHSENVVFQAEPLSITNHHGQAEVTIKLASGEEEVVRPSMIIATDGANSPTRTMLGISKNILAKTTQIAYSILKLESSHSVCKSLKYRVQHFLKATVVLIASIVYACVFGLSIETAYNYVIKGGPSAIFRVPQHLFKPGIDPNGQKGTQAVPTYDYLIRVLREKEQAFIDSYKDKVEVFNFRIKKFNDKLAEVSSEKVKAKLKNRLKVLNDQLAKAKQELENVLTSQAQDVHGTVDMLTSWIAKKHRFQPMTVDKNFLVDIFVGKAEQSLVCVGNTPVILRGDASHSTDPHSGYGCKTAIEETLADQFIFSFGELNQMDEMALSCHQWTHQFYQESMINQGLRDRAQYRPGTELLSRYVDRALKQHIFTQKEAVFFHNIANRAELAQNHGSESFIQFSSLEKKFMNEKMIFLREKLKEQWENRNRTLKGMDQAWIDRLTSQETQTLEKLIQKLIGAPQFINKKTFERMQPILAKLAYENSEFSATVGLLVQGGHLQAFA